MSSTTRRRTGLSLNKTSSPLAGCSTDSKKSLDSLSPTNHNHGSLSSESGQSLKETDECRASSSRLHLQPHNTADTKESPQCSKKSPLNNRLLQVMQEADRSEAPKGHQGDSQEATTSTSPICKSQSTPKRQEDKTANPTTPTDNILEVEDECSPIQMFPGTQAPRLVHWDWHAYSIPNSTSPRKRVVSKRRKQESSCDEVMPPPRRRPRYQRSTLSAELTPLEIELTAIRNKMLASGAYDHLLGPKTEEKAPENDSFDAMFGAASTSDFQVFVETPGTESLLCPALTQTPGPSNISQVQSSVEPPKSSPLKKLSNTKTTKQNSDSTSKKRKIQTNEGFAASDNDVTVEHHSKTGDTNRNRTPTKQIIPRQSLKPVLIEKNLENNNNKKSTTVEIVDLEKNTNIEESTPNVEQKLNASSERKALLIDDSLNEVLIACSMQVEEVCRLSQKQNEIPKPESSTNTAHQVLRNNQSDRERKLAGPNNTIKNSHNFVSSFTTRASAQIFTAHPVPTSNGSSRNISTSSFKTILPTRKSPRIQNQSQKAAPSFKRSASPARKMPVVSVSKSGTDFSPQWVENLKIATSPLNCAPSTRSMSQRAFLKPISPQKPPPVIKKGHESKNISRTLFSKTILPTKPSSSSNSKSVTVKNAETEKPSTPIESASTNKKNVDLNRSHDPFGDSMDFTDLGEIDQIEATFQQQSQCADVIPTKTDSKNNLEPVKAQSGTSLTRLVTLSAVSSKASTRLETKLEVKNHCLPVKESYSNSKIVTIDLTDNEDIQRTSKLSSENKLMLNTVVSKIHPHNSASCQLEVFNKSELKQPSNSHPLLSNCKLKTPVPTSQTTQLGSQHSVPITRSISSSCSSLSATQNQTSSQLVAASRGKLTSAPTSTATSNAESRGPPKSSNSIMSSNMQSRGQPKTSNSNIMSSQIHSNGPPKTSNTNIMSSNIQSSEPPNSSNSSMSSNMQSRGPPKTSNSMMPATVQSSGPSKTSNSNIMSSQHKPFNVSQRNESRLEPSSYQQLDEILKSCNVNSKIAPQQNPKAASTPVPVTSKATVPPTKVANNKQSVCGSPMMRHKSASDFTIKSGSARHGPLLRSNPLVRHNSVGNFSLSQKCSAEDIERKRLEAQQRLQQRRLESQSRQK